MIGQEQKIPTFLVILKAYILDFWFAWVFSIALVQNTELRHLCNNNKTS